MRTTSRRAQKRDLTHLTRVLASGERTFKAKYPPLTAAFQELQLSTGQNVAPALSAIASFERAVNDEVHKLRALQLHSAKGERGRQLAVETLTAMRQSFVSLHTAISSHNSSHAERALKEAKRHLATGRDLMARTSETVGVRWRL